MKKLLARAGFHDPAGGDAPHQRRCLQVLHADYPAYQIIDRVVYDMQGMTLLYYPDELPAETYTVLDRTRRIADCALSSWDNLSQVVFPDGLALIAIERNAFESCDSLTTIQIPDSVIHIGPNAFFSCSTLESVGLPPQSASAGLCRVPSLHLSAPVTIPESVDFISVCTFDSCLDLMSVTLSGRPYYIAPGAFSRCLSDIVFQVIKDSNASQWVQEKGYTWFYIDK